MRVLVDVLGAPERSGGMRLYAEEVIRAWVENDTGDDLLVLGGSWVREAFDGLPVKTITVPERGALRVLAQWFGTPYLAWRSECQALFSVSSIASPLAISCRRVCIVHDWRHLVRPAEFAWQQRLYRRSWLWSINRADKVIQISEKTDRETSRIAPRAHRVVIENGQDHPRSWPKGSRPPVTGPFVLTFGHHSNKRPDLVIRAIALIPPELRPTLVVLGATGSYAQQLHSLAESLQVAEYMQFPGFIEFGSYCAHVQHASAIVLASTDEGYGLPVVEGAYYGVPVISTLDNGVDLIHGDRATYAQPDPASLASAIQDALNGPRSRLTVSQSWQDTAGAIRQVIADLVVAKAR